VTNVTSTTSGFERLRAQIHDAMNAGMPAEIERLAWSADRIEAHQRDGLRRLIGHAVAHSPFHRERLRGVDPDSLELHDLRTLPVMTKSEMMDRFDDVVTDRRVTAAVAEAALDATRSEPVVFADGCFAMASGGSSGLRGIFCLDLDAAVVFYSSLSRRIHVLLESIGGPPPGGVTVAMVCAPSAVHATGGGPALTADPRSPFHFVPVPVTRPLPEIVERLNEINAPSLYGYPTVLARLAAEQRAGRLHLELLRVTCTSEMLLPELRTEIREAFGAPIVDTFGSTEGLVGVSEPDDDVLVFNSDHCIVELVDEANQPVPDGTPSAKVLLTNLANRLQPLIRYELTDRFVRVPPTPGLGHLRARVEGRSDDLLTYDRVTVHPLVISSELVQTPAIVEYRVLQTATGIDVAVVAAGALDADDVRARLERGLLDAGLADATVTVRLVEGLDRDPRTGKISRFVPLR
jgi:phenylacetate-coenzyme A ligase PaaK-like adenylate-forming protein